MLSRLSNSSRLPLAFTLVELLICVAIVGLLLALVLPGMRGAIGEARSFKCQMGERAVAFDFSVFADDQLHGSRGRDDLPPFAAHHQFRLETFQNSQYGVDDFWPYGKTRRVVLPDSQGRDPMRCPEVAGSLVLLKDSPCSQGGVTPFESVSYGFNFRLHESDSLAQAHKNAAVLLTTRILEGDGAATPASIPLLWDVDGQTALERQTTLQSGITPFYSAPSLDNKLLFLNNAAWFPGNRHGNGINVAFIDGHVVRTRDPLHEPNWAWSFDPGAHP